MIVRFILDLVAQSARRIPGPTPSPGPMRRRVIRAFALAACAAVTCAGMALGSGSTGTPASRAEVSYCAEDDPCWDWRTMGDGQRGVCIDDVDWLERADPAAPYDLQRRTYSLGGRGCEALSEDQRSVCWVEPSSKVPERFEIRWYAHLDDIALGNPGFEILCP